MSWVDLLLPPCGSSDPVVMRSPKDTINAQHVIDPSRNGGPDFQYDEVVRGKEDRRHMEAGDCKCYRESTSIFQATMGRPVTDPSYSCLVRDQ